MKLNPSHLETMLTLQESMNSEVNPEWKSANYSWCMAIMMEATEAIDHIGWKWWKKQVPDMKQAQMELVDIWHFLMSAYISNHSESPGIWMLGELDLDADGISIDNIDYTFAELDLVGKLRLIVSLAALDQYQMIKLFQSTLDSAEMTWDDLYISYIGKNTLNFFRQHNGYKQGTYIKNWFGQEDNEFLTEILVGLDINSEKLSAEIYDKLSERYTAIVANEQAIRSYSN